MRPRRRWRLGEPCHRLVQAHTRVWLARREQLYLQTLCRPILLMDSRERRAQGVSRKPIDDTVARPPPLNKPPREGASALSVGVTVDTGDGDGAGGGHRGGGVALSHRVAMRSLTSRCVAAPM